MKEIKVGQIYIEELKEINSIGIFNQLKEIKLYKKITKIVDGEIHFDYFKRPNYFLDRCGIGIEKIEKFYYSSKLIDKVPTYISYDEIDFYVDQRVVDDLKNNDCDRVYNLISKDKYLFENPFKIYSEKTEIKKEYNWDTRNFEEVK